MKFKRLKSKFKISKRCRCTGIDKWFGFKTYECNDNKEYYFTDNGLPVVIGQAKMRGVKRW